MSKKKKGDKEKHLVRMAFLTMVLELVKALIELIEEIVKNLNR